MSPRPSWPGETAWTASLAHEAWSVRVSLGAITNDLVADLAGHTFGPPVTHVYNPLVYARAAWDAYCERYGQGRREVLMIGMNPGPPGLSNPYEGAPDCPAPIRLWTNRATRLTSPRYS